MPAPHDTAHTPQHAAQYPAPVPAAAPLPGRVHVIGASGRSGLALMRALLNRGVAVVAVVRNPAKLAAGAAGLLPRLDVRQADLTQPATLARALGDAQAVVSTAHARHASIVLAAAPLAQRFVFLGSTRKFTRWPDAHGLGVLAGEAAFMASGRPGVMLHPTMIYGATGEDNVQRLAALLARLPLVPLPQGGRALVQPVHQEDVTSAVLAALARGWDGPASLVLPGPAPMAYRDFAAAVAQAAGLAPRPVLSLPAWPLMALAPLLGRLPFLPRIGRDEIRRLLEDKAFDPGPAMAALSWQPRPLAQGLAQTFGRGAG